jgi:signal transduction histidine kinase
VFVLADRSLLGQVLINLLTNAMDAVGAAEAAGAPSEGAGRALILLAVAPTGPREVEFRVVDAGIGIPAERLDRLFDSFYTSKADGMGLGVSMSRSFVEAHGGRIFASNNPAGGATFRFTLPIAGAPAAG